MELDEIVKEFLVESYENLDQLDRDFIVLEQDPTNQDVLARIFRTIHTIKGTCGFLGFERLEKVAHVGENLLSRLRDGELLLNPELISALLTMVDAVRQMLACIESTLHDGEDDYPELVATLTRLHDGDSSAQPPADPAGQAETDSGEAQSATAPAASVLPTEAAQAALVQPAQPSAGPNEVVSPTAKPQPKGDQQPVSSVSDSTIRVDVRLLDKLMTLVGELVLTRNQVAQYTLSQPDTTLVTISQRLNLITTELQEGIMKTRMQTIGNVWSKFPRVVRDLAVACGKQIRVEMEGEDTELDKTIIEAIKDPLTHLIRNAADHGIETPQVRSERGKPAEGCLHLHAYHEGGQVIIEISDDGGGIDPEKIKAKALEKGLITPETAARMSDREVVNLVFLPGFSTAEQVTNVSGRGVGMDVVKTNIEKLGGAVDVHSTLGQGTTFKVKIPLTLAIIPALTVTCEDDRYAIPQINLLELVRLEGEQIQKNIEYIQGAPVYRLRGNLLPLVYLSHELDVKSKRDEPAVANIVVLQADDRQFGLVVDDINDTQEIVVKPLGKILKGQSAFAGATIMGDGRVALILDVLGLAQQANVITETHDRSMAEVVEGHDAAGERQSLLILGMGEQGRLVVQLSQVARLEEIALSAVEQTQGQEVVQYRGRILSLVRLSHVLHMEASPEADPLQVVVYSEEERSVGLVVDRIVDIVEEELHIQHQSSRPGLLGAAIIQERVADVLDVRGIVHMVDPGFLEPAAMEEAA